MKRLGIWLAGGIFSILALAGLAFAGNAHNGGFELFGFVVMAFGILMLVRLIDLTTPNQ